MLTDETAPAVKTLLTMVHDSGTLTREQWWAVERMADFLECSE